MAAEYLASTQTIALNSPANFIASIPCTRGYVYHEDGTGIFILRGIVNNPCANFAQYEIELNANIAVPEGGTVAPIAMSVMVNGESKPSSVAISTPTAVNAYNHITSSAIIKVPRGCCFTVSVDAVPANTTDTPAPAISMANGQLKINRIA